MELWMSSRAVQKCDGQEKLCFHPVSLIIRAALLFGIWCFGLTLAEPQLKAATQSLLPVTLLDSPAGRLAAVSFFVINWLLTKCDRVTLFVSVAVIGYNIIFIKNLMYTIFANTGKQYASMINHMSKTI